MSTHWNRAARAAGIAGRAAAVARNLLPRGCARSPSLRPRPAKLRERLIGRRSRRRPCLLPATSGILRPSALREPAPGACGRYW